ncbi:MAG: adenylyltransferase/cytidyltransferase family protein [bacterium]|nr:adenylyltransferase/cytidyltransferase family protein [bacterium]
MQKNPSTSLRARVLVFGTFDGLHEGHKDFFRQAKEFGDPEINSSNLNGASHLVVVVGRDSTIVKTKGRPPKFNEQERLKAVQGCESVDEARLGNEAPVGGKLDPYKVVEEITPDVICLGYDQTFFADKLAEELPKRGLSHIKIHRLEAFQPEKYKSSLLNKE